MLPTARTEKLTVQELANETLVFDHETAKAHCLNRTAGLVWKHCDGNTDTAEISAMLDLPAESVSLALEQLHRRKLLQGSVPLPARRDALRKLVAAAVLLPAIMTISAPHAMAQASNPCAGQPNFTACSQGGTRCCGGSCITPGGIGTACASNCNCGGGGLICVAGSCQIQ